MYIEITVEQIKHVLVFPETHNHEQEIEKIPCYEHAIEIVAVNANLGE